MFKVNRLIFGGPNVPAPAPTGGGEKPPEAKPDAAGPKPEAAKYTPEMLAAKKRETEAKLADLIKHPAVLKSAKAELDSALSPIKAKLDKLAKDKEADTSAIATEVNRAVEAVLQAERNFSDVTVDGKKFAMDPPRSIKEYGKMEETARDAVALLAKYQETVKGHGGKIDETSARYINGYIQVKVNYPKNGKNPNAPDGQYADVQITSAGITEAISNKEIDEAQKEVGNFYEAFNKWKDSPPPPPDYFSYKGSNGVKQPVDSRGFLTRFGIDSKTSPDKIKEVMGTVGVSPLLTGGKNSRLAFLDSQKTEIRKTEYEKTPDGKQVLKHSENIKTSVLTMAENKKSTDFYANGQPQRTAEEIVKTVAQQLIRQKVVNNYFPSQPGEQPKIKTQETYINGSDKPSTASQYDESGKLVKSESTVEGCDGVKATDLPTGKLVDARDDHDRPIYMTKDGHKFAEEMQDGKMTYIDEQGRRFVKVTDPANPGKFRYEYTSATPGKSMTIDNVGEVHKVPEVIRNMTFNADGKEVKITTYEAMKEEKGGNLSKEEYIKYLAANLKTDQQKHAFIQLMMQYASDPPGKDVFQSWDQTVARCDKKGMKGDCEDYAFLMKEIAEKQGVKGYVIGVEGHVEFITVKKSPDGKYHAASYGTFGVDVDGNRVGKEYDQSKAGYYTLEQALASLEPKWRNSGNRSMEDARIVSTDEKSKPIIKTFKPDAKWENLEVSTDLGTIVHGRKPEELPLSRLEEEFPAGKRVVLNG